MTEKEYLFYVVSNIEVNEIFYTNHRHFDMEKVQVETNFKKFCKNHSLLKKIVYLEEHKIGQDLLFCHDNFKKLDVLFLIDFSDGTNVYTIEKLIKWINTNQIQDDKILIMSHSDNECQLIKKMFNKKTTINFVIVPGPVTIALSEFLGRRYKKRFLFLSRNWNYKRLGSFVDLHRRGILNNSYYSFFNVKNVYSSPISPHEYYSFKEIDFHFNNIIKEITLVNVQWAKELQEYWNDNKNNIIDGMPYTLENETNEISGRSGQQFISNTLQDAFTNSAMSLLIETNTESDSRHFQCTEKTYKSMIYRHPFFVYGTPYQLQRTQQYGFKTFANTFDESYDNLENSWERIYHIHNQVDFLNNLNDSEFKKIIYKTIPETTHNYNLIMNMLSNIKLGIKYQQFDKTFDNLLLDQIPDHCFNNQY